MGHVRVDFKVFEGAELIGDVFRASRAFYLRDAQGMRGDA